MNWSDARSRGLRHFAVVCLAVLLASQGTAAADQSAPPPPFFQVKVGLSPIGGKDAVSQTKDQIQVALTTVDFVNFKEFSDLQVPVQVPQAGGGYRGFRVPVCSLPYFRIEITNRSEQILRIGGSGGDAVVVVFEDDRGKALESVDKIQVKKALGSAVNQLSAMSVDPGKTAREVTAALDKMIAGVPILSEGANVLPGRMRTFYACFDHSPGAKDDQDAARDFIGRSRVTLGVYDVPVQRDVAGNVTKKASYEFPFEVTWTVDHWEYVSGIGEQKGLFVTRLKSTQQVRPDELPASFTAGIAQPEALEEPTVALARSDLFGRVSRESRGVLKPVAFQKMNGFQQTRDGLVTEVVEWQAEIAVPVTIWKPGNAIIGYWSDYLVLTSPPSATDSLLLGGSLRIDADTRVLLGGSTRLHDTEKGLRVLESRVSTYTILPRR